jgi:hypothetical protein
VLLAAAAFAVLAAGAGAHVGAFLRYYDQLFIPLGMLAALLWLKQLGLSGRWIVLALLLDAASGLAYDIRRYPLPSPPQVREWKGVEAWIAGHPRGLYPPLFTSILARHGGAITDNDHTRQLMLGPDGPLKQLAAARMGEIFGTLRRGGYQVAFSDSDWNPGPGYHEVNRLCLKTPLTDGPECYRAYLADAPPRRH